MKSFVKTKVLKLVKFAYLVYKTSNLTSFLGNPHFRTVESTLLYYPRFIERVRGSQTVLSY